MDTDNDQKKDAILAEEENSPRSDSSPRTFGSRSIGNDNDHLDDPNNASMSMDTSSKNSYVQNKSSPDGKVYMPNLAPSSDSTGVSEQAKALSKPQLKPWTFTPHSNCPIQYDVTEMTYEEYVARHYELEREKAFKTMQANTQSKMQEQLMQAQAAGMMMQHPSYMMPGMGQGGMMPGMGQGGMMPGMGQGGMMPGMGMPNTGFFSSLR